MENVFKQKKKILIKIPCKDIVKVLVKMNDFNEDFQDNFILGTLYFSRITSRTLSVHPVSPEL